MPEKIGVLPYTEAEQKEMQRFADDLACSIEEAEKLLGKVALNGGLIGTINPKADRKGSPKTSRQ